MNSRRVGMLPSRSAQEFCKRAQYPTHVQNYTRTQGIQKCILHYCCGWAVRVSSAASWISAVRRCQQLCWTAGCIQVGVTGGGFPSCYQSLTGTSPGSLARSWQSWLDIVSYIPAIFLLPVSTNWQNFSVCRGISVYKHVRMRGPHRIYIFQFSYMSFLSMERL